MILMSYFTAQTYSTLWIKYKTTGSAPHSAHIFERGACRPHLHHSNNSRLLDFSWGAFHIAVNQPLLFPNTPSPLPLCTKTRRESFIHDARHLQPVVLTDSDSREWGDIIRRTTMPWWGNIYISECKSLSLSLSLSLFYSSYSVSACRGYGCHFLQTFAEHSCVTLWIWQMTFSRRLAARQNT